MLDSASFEAYTPPELKQRHSKSIANFLFDQSDGRRGGEMRGQCSPLGDDDFATGVAPAKHATDSRPSRRVTARQRSVDGSLALLSVVSSGTIGKPSRAGACGTN